ncbi:MAG: hypothetical protein ACR2KJ_06130 [Jatrophihabitans sp.]
MVTTRAWSLAIALFRWLDFPPPRFGFMVLCWFFNSTMTFLLVTFAAGAFGAAPADGATARAATTATAVADPISSLCFVARILFLSKHGRGTGKLVCSDPPAVEG